VSLAAAGSRDALRMCLGWRRRLRRAHLILAGGHC